MTDGRAWEGNWRVRLYERVRARGFISVTAFADSRPAMPLIELAKELGEGEVAGIQLLRVLQSEAQQRHQVSRNTRDIFARHFAWILPSGWPAALDDKTRFEVAKLLSFWRVDTLASHQARVGQVGDALLASPPPPGWRPLNPDDELLRTLLPDDEA